VPVDAASGASSQPEEQDLRLARRRLLVLRAAMAGILVLMAAIVVLLSSSENALGWCMGAAAILLGVLSLALARFRCPRCRHRFFNALYGGIHLWVSHTCEHCGQDLRGRREHRHWGRTTTR
jgi:hypothetical protein